MENKKVKIKNFEEKFIDSLVPGDDINYSIFYIKIEGYSNDTIRITPSKSEDQEHYYYLTGEFEKEIRQDYYGGYNTYITFDPYKATKGKIKITYSIN